MAEPRLVGSEDWQLVGPLKGTVAIAGSQGWRKQWKGNLAPRHWNESREDNVVTQGGQEPSPSRGSVQVCKPSVPSLHGRTA